MPSNRLKLNPIKTKFMWCCTSRRLCHVDDFVFNWQEGPVSTSTSVRNLGAFFYQALLLTDHVNRLVRSCYHQLRRIKSVRRALPTSAAIQLVNSFIISRVDYCNSILAAAPFQTSWIASNRFLMWRLALSMAVGASNECLTSSATGSTGFESHKEFRSSVPF